MLSSRRVKIVATVGPAIHSEEGLKKAIESGMNVARMNFSHGSHEDHHKTYSWVREASSSLSLPVSVLQDLQGPKIRVGQLTGEGKRLVEGDSVLLSSGFKDDSDNKIPVDFDGMAEACDLSTRIFLDDGLMELEIKSISGEVVEAEVIEGGLLKSRKGINLPGAQLPVECLTEKDLEDLEFGLELGVDYVALSFVRHGDDIRRLREIIDKKNPDTKIVAKIEMLEALDHLEDIVQLSDAVMVARGDLAVEVGQTMLPGVQKRIIKMCNRFAVPVITATQMLDSMVVNVRPTRAEITDVANAVLDGSDALMLSAETAAGKNPFKCIRTMCEIIQEVERNHSNYYLFDLAEKFNNVPHAIAASTCLTAKHLDVKAIVCLTTSGKTATLISSHRPKAQIYAVTDSLQTLDRLQLVWGIDTYQIPAYKNSEEALEKVQEVLLQKGLVQRGENIIVSLGLPVKEKAKTNTVRVYTVK